MDYVVVQDLKNDTGMIAGVVLHSIPDTSLIRFDNRPYLPVRKRPAESKEFVQILISGFEGDGWIQVNTGDVRTVTGVIR